MENIYTKWPTRGKITREGYQITRSEPSQKGLMYINTSDNRLIQSSTDSDFSVNLLSTNSGLPLLSKQIDKFGVYEIGLNLQNNQVNERNFTVQFYSSNTGTIDGAGKFVSPSTLHTVQILGGTYSSPTTLIIGLVTALNTITGSTGLTFAHSNYILADGTISTLRRNISCTGGTFCFALGGGGSSPMDNSYITNLALVNGRHLFNLSRSQTAVSAMPTGIIQGFYTRYIDISCYELVERSRVPVSTSEKNGRSPPNLLYRLHLDELNTFGEVLKLRKMEEHIRWIKKENSKTIQAIDLVLLDEFGMALILNNLDGDTRNNSYLNITIIAE